MKNFFSGVLIVATYFGLLYTLSMIFSSEVVSEMYVNYENYLKSFVDLR